MDKKNIWLKIIVGLLFLAIIAVLAFISAKKPAQIIENPAGDAILLPHFISGTKSLYYFEAKSNSLKYWDQENNKVEQIIHFDNLGTDWMEYSPDNKMVLVHRTDPQDGINGQTWLVDLKAKKIIRELPANITSAEWRSDSKKIAYHYNDFGSTTNNLLVSDPDGSNSQIITPLLEDYYQFYWISQNQIIYFPVTTEASPVRISIVDTSTKESKYLTQNTYIGDSFKLNDQSILFELSMSVEAGYKLYLYQIKENRFILVNNSAKASPVAAIDNTGSFIGTVSIKDKISLAIFNGNIKENIKISLKNIENISDLYYLNEAIYFVADGSLYVFNN